MHPDSYAAPKHEPSRLDDAKALQEAAVHIEGRYPGMAALMRRCATRLYQSQETEPLRLAFAWIAPLPEGRPSNQATCAYVPRDVYDTLKEAVRAE